MGLSALKQLNLKKVCFSSEGNIKASSIISCVLLTGKAFLAKPY